MAILLKHLLNNIQGTCFWLRGERDISEPWEHAPRKCANDGSVGFILGLVRPGL